MKLKIFLAILTLFALTVFSAETKAQTVIAKDSLTSGAGVASDTTATFTLNGRYAHVYIDVNDTQSGNTDSIYAYHINYTQDTIPLGAVQVLENAAVQILIPGAGNKRSYKLNDAFIYKLYIVQKNVGYVSGRKTKINIRGVTYKE